MTLPRPYRASRAALMAGLILLAGCSDWPDLGSALSPDAANAPYPRLAPLGGVLAQVPEGRITDETTADLQARAAGLRGRAARLRRTQVLDGAARRDLQRASATRAQR